MRRGAGGSGGGCRQRPRQRRRQTAAEAEASRRRDRDRDICCQLPVTPASHSFIPQALPLHLHQAASNRAADSATESRRPQQRRWSRGLPVETQQIQKKGSGSADQQRSSAWAHRGAAASGSILQLQVGAQACCCVYCSCAAATLSLMVAAEKTVEGRIEKVLLCV